MADPVGLPSQSPLFHAEQAARYDRQTFIAEYEQRFECRLIVMIDAIFPFALTLVEDLIYDADPKIDMHLLLGSPGGDGETAVRLVRSMQERCRELTVIVADQAKSAATILTMGAHHILMGPTSDLGPVDPQFQLPDGSLASARNIIAAVDEAAERIQGAPDTYPLHAALLSDVTGLMVQQARSAIARTHDLVEEALRSNPARPDDEIERLKETLRVPLIETSQSHSALFGIREAIEAGLPVVARGHDDLQWQMIWRLRTKYFALSLRAYEGTRASKTLLWPQEAPE